MPTPIHICLSEEEDRTLRELSHADGVPHRTRQRATAVRLNASQWTVSKIACYLDWHEHTVRVTLQRWQSKGLGGLWEALGRGRPGRWNHQDGQALEQWVNEPRRYSAAQLSYKLSQERQVELGKEQVRRILKKNYNWKRIRLAPPDQSTSARYQAKRVDWEMLKVWAQLGMICRKYLDESGCCPHSPTNYSYGKRGGQKRIKQCKR